MVPLTRKNIKGKFRRQTTPDATDLVPTVQDAGGEKPETGIVLDASGDTPMEEDLEEFVPDEHDSFDSEGNDRVPVDRPSQEETERELAHFMDESAREEEQMPAASRLYYV